MSDAVPTRDWRDYIEFDRTALTSPQLSPSDMCNYVRYYAEISLGISVKSKAADKRRRATVYERFFLAMMSIWFFIISIFTGKKIDHNKIYSTVIGNSIFMATDHDQLASPYIYYTVLCHELVHVLNKRRMGAWRYNLKYIFSRRFRAAEEMRAYLESILANIRIRLAHGVYEIKRRTLGEFASDPKTFDLVAENLRAVDIERYDIILKEAGFQHLTYEEIIKSAEQRCYAFIKTMTGPNYMYAWKKKDAKFFRNTVYTDIIQRQKHHMGVRSNPTAWAKESGEPEIFTLVHLLIGNFERTAIKKLVDGENIDNDIQEFREVLYAITSNPVADHTASDYSTPKRLTML
jgi:hypothetical protein